MKCPKCQAKLLPVDGEMFCLQCGTVAALKPGEDGAGPELEDTSDPLLQKAIKDASEGQVRFRLPVSGVESKPKTTAFVSMRVALAPVRPLPAGGGGAEAGTVLAPILRPAAVRSRAVAKRPGWAWLAGAVVLAGFVLINAGLFWYFSNHVYPGVRVGQTKLGGLSYAQLQAKLASLAPQPALTVYVGGTPHRVAAGSLGQADLDEAGREARAAGHDSWLPAAGLARMVVSRPAVWRWRLNETAVDRMAAGLAAPARRAASNAVPVVMGGQVFVISEKSGVAVDEERLAQSIRDALRTAKPVLAVTPDKLQPVVTAAAYKTDVDEAQTRLALNIQLKVRTKSYTPTAAQVGDWLVFAGPGKGVGVDESRVAAYVATVPGLYDRAAAVTALAGAVRAKQNLAYTASTRKVTAGPAPATGGVPVVATYTYCASSDVATPAGTALTAADGWSLGGRVKFVPVPSGCNVNIRLVKPAEMASLNRACAGHSTCQAGDEIVLDVERWAKAPAVWTGSLSSYRAEMLNHEVGHWLGFDHASCLNTAAPQPILQAPTVVLGGCSPNWYEIPVDTQGTQVLAGF